MSWQNAPSGRVHLLFRVVAVGALVASFAQVTLGGIVRVTGSGLGCPDWPLCHGRLVPAMDYNTLIEYTHRLSATALSVLLLAVTALAWVFYRSSRWIVVPSVLGLALVALAAVLGGVTVIADLDWWTVLFHLGVAELVVACALVVVIGAWRGPARQAPVRRQGDMLNTLALASAAGAFVLILSGSYMVGYGAGSACVTWPLCNGSLIPEGASHAVHMGHRMLSAVVGLLIVATSLAACLHRAPRPELRWAALALVLVFAAQVLAGAGMVWSGFSSSMKGLHLSLATLVWMTSVSLATLIYFPRGFEVREAEKRPAALSKLEGSTP